MGEFVKGDVVVIPFPILTSAHPNAGLPLSSHHLMVMM